jgi:L-histidine N-alpha-methyltransferase
VAGCNQAGEQIEIFARFAREQTVRIAPLGKEFTIGKGEMIPTEICRKFRLEEFVRYIEAFGFTAKGIFTDERRWFALLLLSRSAPFNK